MFAEIQLLRLQNLMDNYSTDELIIKAFTAGLNFAVQMNEDYKSEMIDKMAEEKGENKPYEVTKVGLFVKETV